ncbi:MAG TPA: hypothetical protein VME66_15765 [Candidatus Acidoferrales bacterium]|nr:hypothetical protein [Candidatus Acidoferrales bacterium]
MLLAILVGALSLFTGVAGGVTLHAGAILHTTLAHTVDAATAQVDQPIVFVVTAPYPNGDAGLAGAKVIAHITDITRPGHGARIGFVFSHIHFADGETEPIAAYVDDAAFTRREPADFAPSGVRAQMPGIPTLGGAQSQTLVQVDLGPKPFRPTGGWVYASHAGGDIVLQAGTAYSLELAREITVPTTTVRPQSQSR